MLGLSTPADGDEILFRPRPAGSMDDAPAALPALPPASGKPEESDDEIPVVIADEEDGDE